MRKIIDGINRAAKIGAVKKMLKLSKEPVKAKLASLKPFPSDSKAVSEGGQMSGMNSFLPDMSNSAGMQHQRLKLGEVNKKRKKDEEDI